MIGFAEIVLVSLLLSPGSDLNKWTLLGSIFGVFVVAVVVGRHTRLPPVGSSLRAVLVAFRDPVLVTIALAAAGVVVYSIALGLFTPPNEEDVLHYHLARAAFWRQQ